MEIEYIKEFVILAETLHYSEAADILFISPASLTRHVQAIEKQLDSPLFRRTTRHVELTEFGKLFYQYAKKIAFFYDEYSTKLRSQQLRQKKLVIGSPSALAPYHGFALQLTSFKKAHPEISLENILIPADKQYKFLDDATCSFVFSVALRHSKSGVQLSFLPLVQDRLVVLFPPSHPLYGQTAIELQQLSDTPLAIPSIICLMESAFLSRCREVGLAPDFVVADGIDLMDQVILHERTAVAPEQMLMLLSENPSAVTALEPGLTETFGLSYSSANGITALEQTFLSYIAEQQA